MVLWSGNVQKEDILGFTDTHTPLLTPFALVMSIKALSIAVGESPEADKPTIIFWMNFMAVFLCSGVIFGFPALAARLRARGQYSELCDEDDIGDYGTVCEAQTLRFSLLVVVPTFTFFLSVFAWGNALDRLGPRIASTGSSLLTSLGALLLPFCDSASFDAYMPALVLITIGGPGVYLSGFNVCNLYGPQARARTSVHVAAMISSALVFPICAYAIDGGVQPAAVFFTYFGLLGTCLC